MGLKYVAQVEIELTQDELDKFAELSKQWSQNLPDTVRECMNRYCEDTLTTFAQEPENEQDTDKS